MIRRLRERTRGAVSGQRGYTLVELIVATAIFVTISVVAVGVLVSVLNSSSKTAARRSVQQDARVNIEEVARTVRASSIDYAFYEPGEHRCQTNGYVNDTTGTTAINGSIVLPLLWSEAVPGGEPNRKRVIFFYDPDAQAVYRYETPESAPPPSCSQLFSSADKVRLTGEGVEVTKARFFVSPIASPYKDPCANKNSLCQVRRNTHPRVTILMVVKTLGDPDDLPSQARYSEMTIQTTIGSRAYPVTGLVGQAAPEEGP
ncbi:MAG TPA: type II secretion system protein [Patescibacteria group bacterium]|jgi:prepilin-type N-terminal cleavage/methylation domain-containing protein